MSFNPNVFVPILVICYVAWRVYRRMRLHIGKQPLQPRRIVGRIIIYSAIVLLFGASALRDSSLLTGIGIGLFLGAALAMVGLRLTVFETTPQGQFYTPNTLIGIGLSVLLIARLVYRVGVLYDASSHAGPRAAALVQSPLTLLFFGLLFGYYIAYYAGVLARGAKQKSPPTSSSTQSADAISEV
jgi:hypothetical protein